MGGDHLWEAVGAVGEVVGAIAVVVTLGYLAIQIRTNTRATQTASRHEITRDYRHLASLMLDDRTAHAYRKGVYCYPNEMNSRERSRFAAMMTQEVLFFQAVFAQHENDQLEEETYGAYLLWISALISTPGAKAWWDEVGRSVLVPKTVRAVDERISKGQLPDILEWAQFSRSDET